MASSDDRPPEAMDDEAPSAAVELHRATRQLTASAGGCGDMLAQLQSTLAGLSQLVAQLRAELGRAERALAARRVPVSKRRRLEAHTQQATQSLAIMVGIVDMLDVSALGEVSRSLLIASNGLASCLPDFD
jgi:hypothetical protein